MTRVTLPRMDAMPTDLPTRWRLGLLPAIVLTASLAGAALAAPATEAPVEPASRSDEVANEELPAPEPALRLEAPLAPDAGVDPIIDAADRIEAGRLFRALAADRDYPRALDAAARALELGEADLGPTSPELVTSLNDMGLALLLNRRPSEAQQYFSRSIALIEDSEGIFSTRLFDPMLGLGRCAQAIGQHSEAIELFQRAQHVTHRSEGVYNLTQVPAMSALVESLLALERWEEAENVQVGIYRIHRGNLGERSLESLPAMYELASWYREIYDFRQAREIYNDAVELIEDQLGPDAPELVEPLRGMAATWQAQRSTHFVKGVEAHERIVRILDGAPEADPSQRIIAHLELGDWYVQFNREEDAWAAYRRAWELARGVAPEEFTIWAGYFDRPHLIHPGATLSPEYLSRGTDGEDEVYYDFEFDIGRDGRPEEIDVIGTNLHGQTRSAAIQAFRYARFRPRMVDGTTVVTSDYKVRRIYPTAFGVGDTPFSVGTGPAPLGR